MITVPYSDLRPEAEVYWKWFNENPLAPVPAQVAKEGSGSESRTPLMHFGTVVPVYLSVVRYLKKLSPMKGSKLIEIGCGTGRALAHLKSVFPEVDMWGIDSSASAIGYARRNYGSYGINFLHADAIGQAALGNAAFEFVVSSHVIEHIKKQEGLTFLRRCRSLLKPGGYLFIGTPNRKRTQDLYMRNPNDAEMWRLNPPHEHEYTFSELMTLAERVFGQGKTRMDALNNPLFRSVFGSSVARISPNSGMMGKVMSFLYISLMNVMPRTIFDRGVRTYTEMRLRSNGVSYRDVLRSNRVEPEAQAESADNLLLVCEAS
jgi:ubiquinone/menaquinone biosynthesis C-methylase UbiE